MKKINLLINLPKEFFKDRKLNEIYGRLSRSAVIRKRSHNTAQEIQKDLSWAEAVIMWSWPALDDGLLDKAPRLKFSGQIDVTQSAAAVALRRGLAVSVSRGGFSPAVSEMALALVLSLLRKVSDYHAAMRSGREKWISIDNFPANIDPDERQLTGRPVGIIGFGRVGQRFSELLRPFRCDISIYDPFLPAEVAAKQGVKKTSLHGLIKSSEVVVLCAASNKGTAHLIGRKELSLFRRKSIFVNVARAALVDTGALINRLRKGDLYAAIDVFDREPLDRNSALRKIPNAYLTPHRAGGIHESVYRNVAWLADDLEAFLKGKELSCPLTEKMLPSLDS